MLNRHYSGDSKATTDTPYCSEVAFGIMLSGMRKVRLRVREVAAEKGMSRTRLHHDSEVAYTTIRAIFKDPHTEVTITTLARLAEALGVPTAALIEDEEE